MCRDLRASTHAITATRRPRPVATAFLVALAPQQSAELGWLLPLLAAAALAIALLALLGFALSDWQRFRQRPARRGYRRRRSAYERMAGNARRSEAPALAATPPPQAYPPADLAPSRRLPPDDDALLRDLLGG